MQYLAHIITLSIGLILGYFLDKTRVDKQRTKIKKRLNPPNVGTVRQPTAEQLKTRGTPQEKEDEAMSKTLSEIVG